MGSSSHRRSPSLRFATCLAGVDRDALGQLQAFMTTVALGFGAGVALDDAAARNRRSRNRGGRDRGSRPGGTS